MKIIKKILFIVFLIILIPLIIYNVVIFYKSMKNPNQVPDFLGYKTFIVLSGSMKPKINVNDMIVVKKVKEEEIKKNDVIAFNDSDKIITHRIVDITVADGKNFYVTKGDANNKEDDYDITYDNIEGKLVYTIPKIGKVFKFFQGKTIIIILIIYALGVCLYNYIKK